MIRELVELYREWDRFYEQHDKKRQEIIARLLPVGTKVSWQHGKGVIKGTVIELPQWCGEYLYVRNDTSKTKRQIQAGRLTILESRDDIPHPVQEEK